MAHSSAELTNYHKVALSTIQSSLLNRKGGLKSLEVQRDTSHKVQLDQEYVKAVFKHQWFWTYSSSHQKWFMNLM